MHNKSDDSALQVAQRIVETLNPSPGHFMFGKIIPATEVDTVARAYLAAREALEKAKSMILSDIRYMDVDKRPHPKGHHPYDGVLTAIREALSCSAPPGDK